MTVDLSLSEISELIRVTRSDVERLYNLHQLSIESNGNQGLKCLNPEKLDYLMNRTDEEILQDYMAQGYTITKADEYLASIKTE